MDTAAADHDILLDHYHLSQDSCLLLVDGITQGTDSIVSNGSFNPDSSISSAGTLAFVLAPSIDCDTKLYAKGTTGKQYQRKTNLLTMLSWLVLLQH